MKEYLFVFGRDPELSFLELRQFLYGRKIYYVVREVKSEIAVIALENLEGDLANILGGTVRIGEVIGRDKEALHNFPFLLSDKMRLSICVYKNSSLYPDVKTFFKIQFKNERLRYLFSKNTAPSKLKKDYLEILLFKNYIAKTISLFNPSLYKERDKRPCNDYLKNTSIRLARILINLSGIKKGTLLDPFCGTGIILQEALLLGYNVYGIDHDIKSVSCSQQNLAWTKKRHILQNRLSVVQGDAGNIPFRDFDFVVTEPYLGPYVRGTLNFSEAQNIKKSLENLYRDFFKNLKPCRVVFILPRFQTKKGSIMINNVFDGFRVLHGPILYADEKSKIIREIYVLEKR